MTKTTNINIQDNNSNKKKKKFSKILPIIVEFFFIFELFIYSTIKKTTERPLIY